MTDYTGSLIQKLYAVKVPEIASHRERLAFGIAIQACAEVVRRHAAENIEKLRANKKDAPGTGYGDGYVDGIDDAIAIVQEQKAEQNYDGVEDGSYHHSGQVGNAVANSVCSEISVVDDDLDFETFLAELGMAIGETLPDVQSIHPWYKAGRVAYEKVVEWQRQREPVSSGWRPIETAPKDGSHFLIMGHDGVNYWECPEVAYWAEEAIDPSDKSLKPGFVEYGGDMERYWNPTHWMALPAHPQDGD